jgi:hypothetical protein
MSRSAKKPTGGAAAALFPAPVRIEGTRRPDTGKFAAQVPPGLRPGTKLLLVTPCSCEYTVSFPESTPQVIIFKGSKCDACKFIEPSAPEAWFGPDGDVKFAEMLYVLDEKPGSIPDKVYETDNFTHRFPGAGRAQAKPFFNGRLKDAAGNAIRDHLLKLKKHQAQVQHVPPECKRSRRRAPD